MLPDGRIKRGLGLLQLGEHKFCENQRNSSFARPRFLPGDESSGAIVALVNEAFVKMFLNGREPIGATLGFHREPGDTDADLPLTRPMTVVGVVENEVQGGDLGAPYEPMVYLDYLALPRIFLSAVFSMSAQYAVRSALPEPLWQPSCGP